MEINRNLERRLKQHLQGKEHCFRVVVPPGFEPVSIAELASLGIGATALQKGTLEFTARLESLWKAHAACRTLNRIRMVISSFRASHPAELRHGLEKISWELYLGARPLQWEATCRESRLIHSGLVEEVASDVLRKAGYAALPGDCVQTIHLRLQNDRCEVSLDASGELLYRRGFQRDNGRAPVRDTLAAAMLQWAGLFQVPSLYDPMAGSGTFSLEALQASQGIYPFACRKFAFEDWPSFRPAAYQHLCKALTTTAAHKLQIHCADNDPRAVDRIAYNLRAIPAPDAQTIDCVQVSLMDFFSAPFPQGVPGLVVLNPPYGSRIAKDLDTVRFYRDIGRKLRKDAKGWRYAIIAPSAEAERALALAPQERIAWRHGGLAVGSLKGFL